MSLLLLLAAGSVAAADCPAQGKPIVGVSGGEAPLYAVTTGEQIGSITVVKGVVSPSLTVEGCVGRYFVALLNGRRVAVTRKDVIYQSSMKAGDICVERAGGSDAAATSLAGPHANDPMNCVGSAAGGPAR